MMKPNTIRPLAVCIIEKNGKVLASKGVDSKKNETFYRLLGGGIEFGERGEEALKREFVEEIDTGLENVKFVTVLENIFTYEGEPGHEIVMVYKADLANKDLYSRDNIKIKDDEEGVASWQKIEEFKNKKLILYPSGIVDYI